MKYLLQFCSLVGGIALLGLPAGAVHAQTYPSKPITVIVPFPPGGTTDLVARTIGQKLSEAWGQSVVIDNRGGAGATLGAGIAARAPADGYTLFIGAVHHTIATSVYKKLSYDFQKDFTPVALVAAVPNVLVVNASLPVKSVNELIAYAKANPGTLTFGSNGAGTAQHLIGAQFNIMAGTDITHVPYKGSGPLTTDLVGGQISMSFDSLTSNLPHIKSGKLRALAVVTAKRSALLPEVPTMQEAAPPGFVITTWYGVMAPARTPPEIVKRLNAEIVKILGLTDVKKRLADGGVETLGSTPEEMAAYVRDETEKFAKLAREARITVE